MGKLIKIGLCDDETYIHKEIFKIIEKYQKERECSIEMFSFFTARELLETEKSNSYREEEDLRDEFQRVKRNC